MAASVQDIKKLKDITNAGMMDCKKALESSNGDFDAALKFLKEKGLADAKKRSDRETKEGGVYIKEDNNKIAMIQIGCETDFVSNNEVFLASKDAILDKVISTGDTNVDSYKEEIQNAIAQTKENIEFKNAVYIELKDKQYGATYIHGKNKIGVLAIFDNVDDKIAGDDKFKEAANNICLHIAASAPYYMTDKEVPAKEVEEQKSIMLKQMEDSGKPADVLEKIVTGKLSKYFSETCLLSQKYVKDDKITIEKYVASVAKELGSDIKLSGFHRFMIGG